MVTGRNPTNRPAAYHLWRSTVRGGVWPAAEWGTLASVLETRPTYRTFFSTGNGHLGEAAYALPAMCQAMHEIVT